MVIECRADEAEAVLAEAAAADVELAGVEEPAEEERGTLRLWLADDGDAAPLAARLRAWAPRIESADTGQNWNEAWQRSEWRAIEVGRRFFLVPPWDGFAAAATPPGRIRLAMHAGTAFGNGDHPATHLCLMAMEEELWADDVFLDVGCGSGLLGEAAVALGARAAWGCDVARGIGSFTGSVDAVRTASCDYVAANIQLGVLLELLGDIRRVLRPGGRGVLSGILPEQRAELEAASRAAGLMCSNGGGGAATMELSGWAAVRIAAPAAAPPTTLSCA